MALDVLDRVLVLGLVVLSLAGWALAGFHALAAVLRLFSK